MPNPVSLTDPSTTDSRPTDNLRLPEPHDAPPSSMQRRAFLAVRGFFREHTFATVALLLLGFLLAAPRLVSWLTTQAPAVLPHPEAGRELGVREMIRSVKQELQDADKEMRDNREVALFELKEFDLEISFVARASSTAKSGFDYQVLTVDTEKQAGSEKVQKLHLHFVVAAQGEKQSTSASKPSPLPSSGVVVIGTPPPRKGGNP
jgi:Trypsin-co-occurring domain 2